jgi:hypothetical protein
MSELLVVCSHLNTSLRRRGGAMTMRKTLGKCAGCYAAFGSVRPPEGVCDTFMA